jgi:glucan phosphorylase
MTSELYGGGSELRLKQELVLGIGGWRLLEELGIRPQVCHINEGHAAFVVLERDRGLMNENTVPFEVALAASRAGNLFTTHTPVPAGFDYFEPELIKTYLTGYANELLGISMDELLALGRKNPQDHFERLIWLIWPYTAAALSMRSVNCMEKSAVNYSSSSLNAGLRTRCLSEMSRMAFICRHGIHLIPTSFGPRLRKGPLAGDNKNTG